MDSYAFEGIRRKESSKGGHAVPLTPSARRTLALAAHVLATLAKAQHSGDVLTLDGLAELVDAPRAEVRTCVSHLHEEGFVDAARMRLTLRGFTLGSALAGRKLMPLRLVAIAAA